MIMIIISILIIIKIERSKSYEGDIIPNIFTSGFKSEKMFGKNKNNN